MIICMCVCPFIIGSALPTIGCGGRDLGSLGGLVVASAAYTSSYGLKMGHWPPGLWPCQ